ncbi:Chromosome-partitioning protein Spo0J [Phycisphaerae bacterium RAS1]|nr:Chromosome-partitioning protein Spo0J [Phycisphaerae bacterium RAS1]
MEAKAIQLAPLSRIEVRSNVRDRLVESEQIALAGNIAENGVLSPCVGYVDGPKIVPVIGHRRIDAATRAGLDCVPMIVLDHVPTPAEILILQLSENCVRSDLRISERARAIESLMQKSDWSAARVSQKLRLGSEATISRLLTLLVLPQTVLDLVDAGRIPISSATSIASVPNADERQRLIDEVLAGRLSRDRLVKRVKSLRTSHHRSSQPRRAKRPARERFTVHLGPGRSLTVSGPNLSLTSLTEWLQALLKRIGRLEPQDMALADAAKALSADASCKGVVS